MRFIEGENRYQIFITSLENMVDPESVVRVIDKFVDIQDLHALGMTRTESKETGRLGYSAAILTKVLLYGYDSSIRPSRKLERECERNVEVMWLTGGLKPDHKTISEFRRENAKGLQKLFREFVKLCKEWDLIGGEIIVRDGTKVKASNNKKNNYSRKKANARKKHLEDQIIAYMKGAEEADSEDERAERDKGTEDVSSIIKELEARKAKYEGYLKKMDEEGTDEISIVDPDARLMGNNRGGVDVAYNVQSTVDAKHHLVVDYDVIQNPSDQGQMAIAAKRMIRKGYRKFSLLLDKGYYNGKDLSKVKRMKIHVIVARQKPSNPKGQPKQFHTENFKYNEANDEYTCPTGQTLNAHSRMDAERRNFFNKEACAICPHLKECTTGERPYRVVSRNKYAKEMEEADRIYAENKELYRLRQQTVEHPFGTIKFTLGGYYFLLRTRRKVRCEVALLFLSYNMKRAINILGFRGFMDRLEAKARLNRQLNSLLRFISCRFKSLEIPCAGFGSKFFAFSLLFPSTSFFSAVS